MHCGWLPRSEWLPLPWGRDPGRRPPSEAQWPYGQRVRQSGTLALPGAVYASRNEDTGKVYPNVCPGYAARLPMVERVVKAHRAYEKGALAVLHPRLLVAEAEGIDVLDRAVGEYRNQEREAQELQRAAERAARGNK
jgi:hypothetical protein